MLGLGVRVRLISRCGQVGLLKHPGWYPPCYIYMAWFYGIKPLYLVLFCVLICYCVLLFNLIVVGRSRR